MKSSYSDLRESGYRNPHSNLCYSIGFQTPTQQHSMCLPRRCILLSDWTTSCLCSLYCTPSSYWLRTHDRILLDSSAGALPLPKKMRRNNYDSEDKYYIFFRFKSLLLVTTQIDSWGRAQFPRFVFNILAALKRISFSY